MNILIRCDGSFELGLGHVVRSLALADCLSEGHGCRVAFAIREGELAVQMIETKYRVIRLPGFDTSFNYLDTLTKSLKEADTQVLVLDVRDNIDRLILDALRDQGVRVVTIDDPEEKRLSSDMAFYPPVPQVSLMDWSGFEGDLFVGWEYVLLRQEFSRHYESNAGSNPKLLLTMGGSDPYRLTLLAAEALKDVDERMSLHIILGQGYGHHEELKEILKNCPHSSEWFVAPANVAQVMAGSDLAIAAFGVTAYELAALGVPAIYLSISDDHARSARFFEDEGLAVSLGHYAQVKQDEITSAVNRLMNDDVVRMAMGNRAREKVDGQGAERIARAILSG